jgi:predicted polyphosphate/ATP-dependent NAD kinase
MARIGLVINPIAGMGGRVGLKGTDGVAAEAERLGAAPIANGRALEALRELKRLLDQDSHSPPIQWLTCPGEMGGEALRSAGFEDVEPAHEPKGRCSAEDTKQAVRAFVAARVDLVLLCGGDGTARDVCSVTGKDTPVLGIPAGVKMYSGVFGVTPARTAEVVLRFLKGEIGLADVEVLDLDEEKYRADEWAVRHYMAARTPCEPTRVQAAKMLIEEEDDDQAKQAIGDQLGEDIKAAAATLFLLGPGSTVQSIAQALGVDKTLLGIDAIVGGRLVGKDLDERQLLELLAQYPQRKLVLSPIGAQGFVLGRGNQQLSPTVVKRIGLDNIVVVATPAKLARTPILRFDTGDSALDEEMISPKFLTVIVGYRRTRLVKVAA